MLLGYAGALRRSELVAVTCEDIQFSHEGLRLLTPRGKGDQTGKGVSIGLPRGESRATCPVRAVEAWLEVSGWQYGPVFRAIDARGIVADRGLHPDAARRILAKRAVLAGLAVPAGERLSPHGLRAAFITQAYIAGARDEQIMDHTRQKDIRAMRGYRNLLVRLYGFYVPFEAASSVPPHRSRWIAADLHILGLRDPLGDTPRCPHIPSLHNAYLALGSLYVVEGSALGGRDLARGLDRLLGDGVPQGRRFFIGRGSGTNDAWRSYLAQLSAAPQDGRARADIVRGAVETFAAFERWLSGWRTSSHG